jgi:hypothetical protein
MVCITVVLVFGIEQHVAHNSINNVLLDIIDNLLFSAERRRREMRFDGVLERNRNVIEE